MGLFLISFALAFFSAVGIVLVKNISQKKFGDTWIGPICVILLVVSVVFGLGMGGTLRVVRTEYVEMRNCIRLKSPDAIIIDLTNSPDNWPTFETLIKFNSYKAVTEFSDSTKIFREIDRSFYNVPVYSRVVWSNPPYKDFYKE